VISIDRPDDPRAKHAVSSDRRVLAPKGSLRWETDQDDVAMMPYTTVQKKMLGQAISVHQSSECFGD
jgi:hypothetical protein